MGVGRFLKERNPLVQIWAIEPPAGETVDGLKSLDEGFVPPVFLEGGGYDLLDRKRIVGPRESIEWTRQLASAGVFAGISSGAAMAAAGRCAAEIESGVIVALLDELVSPIIQNTPGAYWAMSALIAAARTGMSVR